ncbi:hypothetical protein EG329_011935 [Mollisiaceae sp. DMI_Dod_QoI]|nr:hypothetical protein EG329_011935 [Helotiales sp. DMI_Dod_QoI]
MLPSLVLVPLVAGIASAINLTVASSGGNATSPMMYGLMFEDINHSGDGGIYAELIQNRAFQGSTEHPSTLHPWIAAGNATLTLQNTSIALSSALPVSVKVAASNKSTGKIGLLNPGWWGMDVKPQPYKGSFWALGSYNGTFTVKLQSAITNQVFASLDIDSLCQVGKWVEHKYTLEPKIAASNSNNSFILEFDSGQGSVNFNLISLFPPTYNNSPNGNRPDIMSALKDLNPSFLRMPGGNNLEGDSYHYRWAWNKTIGPLTNRPGRPGTWGYENTDGLGLIEYFNWCTDLKMEPLLAVWSGMYLGSHDVLTASALAPYVNDTMNELEFILGSPSTPYGSLRASLGYPDPWALKYVEIGNEDNLEGGASSYASYRFNQFYTAISAKYPSITIISSSGDLSAVGPGSATDFHIYSLPDYFVSQFGKWDNVPRSHKVLIGEYANVQYNIHNQPSAGVNWSAPKLVWPIWAGAVSESVWSIGAERNGDVILGQSYAPGLMNMNSYEWSPDLISFTASPSQTVLSTSYHAISLLSSFRYNSTVPVTTSPFGPAYWVAGVSNPGQYTFKVAIYNATSSVPFNISFEGLGPGAKGTLTVLTAPDGLSSNKLVNGTVVDIVRKEVKSLTAGEEGSFEFELENYSVAVLTT